MRMRSFAALSTLLGAAGVALAGPDWVEQGDAGSDLTSAQVPVGTTGNLNSISGALAGGLLPDYEDCYIIRINNPSLFSIQVQTANFNAQLFMFNISIPGGAYGLLANDDRAVGNNLPRFTNVSNDGTNVIVDLPGDYMIAVTGFNRDPNSQTGAIFNQASVTEVSGPDGPGGFNRLTGWSGAGEFGNYIITLTGAGPPNFPAPGAAGLLVLGGLVGMRRKR